MLVRAKDPRLEPEDIADADATGYHATDKRITIVIAFLARVRRRLKALGSPDLTATFVGYLAIGVRRPTD